MIFYQFIHSIDESGQEVAVFEKEDPRFYLFII